MRVQRHLVHFHSPNTPSFSEKGDITLFVPIKNKNLLPQLKIPSKEKLHKLYTMKSSSGGIIVPSNRLIIGHPTSPHHLSSTIQTPLNTQKRVEDPHTRAKHQLRYKGFAIQEYQSSPLSKANEYGNCIDTLQLLRNFFGPLGIKHHLLLITLLWTGHALFMFIPHFYVQQGNAIPREDLSFHRFSRMNGRFLASLLAYFFFFVSFRAQLIGNLLSHTDHLID
jgi:hypothetical protein